MNPFPFPAEGLGQAADFARRVEQLRREGDARVRSALMALVEVADAVGRVCDDPSATDLPPGLRDGLAALRGKVGATLAGQGVTPIPTAGHPLDLQLHRVAEVCSGPGAPETIVRELRPGYLWDGRVLRPADVVTVGPTPQGDRPQ